MMSREAPFLEKTHLAAAEKDAIATVAAAMVADGDAIAFGPGTTTLSLARLLTNREDLTVVTNSILVSQALQEAPGIHLLLSGGLVRSATHALVGPIAEQSLAGLFVTTLFLSGNGLTAARGLSTPDVLTAAVDRRLAASAARVVVLADYTKVGVETMSLTVAIDEIDTVITDPQADPEELERLRDAGVEVVVAGQPETEAGTADTLDPNGRAHSVDAAASPA